VIVDYVWLIIAIIAALTGFYIGRAVVLWFIRSWR
jgi:hypothetical protein